MDKTRSFSNTYMALCAISGLAIALFLTAEHNKPDLNALCGVTGGCTGALHSAYGHVGPIPTALFGAGMYLVVLVLCLLRARRARVRAAEDSDSAGAAANVGPNVLDGALWLLALAAFGVSWWLQYVALFVIEHFCPYCFASALLVTQIFCIATWDVWLSRPGQWEKRKTALAVIGGVLGVAALWAIPTIQTQWQKINIPIVTADEAPIDVDANLRSSIVSKEMNEKGAPNAPTLLVEFGDYQCPTCKDYVAYTEAALKKHKGKLRLAFRNFPLSRHTWSTEAAEAALAASAQGKFWPMHDMIYAQQSDMEGGDFTPARFVDYARRLGLDTARFQRDMKARWVADRIAADKEDAKTCDVTTTPTLFLVSSDSILRIRNHDAWERVMDKLDIKREVAKK